MPTTPDMVILCGRESVHLPRSQVESPCADFVLLTIRTGEPNHVLQRDVSVGKPKG